MISSKEFGDEIERLHNAKNNLSMTPEGRRKIVNLAQSRNPDDTNEDVMIEICEKILSINAINPEFIKKLREIK